MQLISLWVILDVNMNLRTSEICTVIFSFCFGKNATKFGAAKEAKSQLAVTVNPKTESLQSTENRMQNKEDGILLTESR